MKLLSEEQCVRSALGAAGLDMAAAGRVLVTLPPIEGRGASLIFLLDALAALRACAVFSMSWLDSTGGAATTGGGDGGIAGRGGGGARAAAAALAAACPTLWPAHQPTLEQALWSMRS